MNINQAVPESIKQQNARAFAQVHQSAIFQWDEATQPDGWQTAWDYLIERVDSENPPTLTLMDAETKDSKKQTFSMDFGDIDPVWWLVCLRFGIEEWTQEGIAEVLSSEFYKQTEQLKHPETDKVADLNTHINDFLQQYPHGGTQGIHCDLSELFTLEEI